MKISNIARSLQEDIALIKTEDRLCDNLAAIVHAIAYFTSIYMGMNLKVRVWVQKVFILSKRFFGIPCFYHYAMADGIFALLKKINTGLSFFQTRQKTSSYYLIFIPSRLVPFSAVEIISMRFLSF